MTSLVFNFETLKHFNQEHFISLLYGMVLTAPGENMTACEKGADQLLSRGDLG